MPMFISNLMGGAVEFLLSAAASIVVACAAYRAFILVHAGLDAHEQIKKGNMAVTVLAGAVVAATSWIVQRGLANDLNNLRMHMMMFMTQGQGPVRVFSAALLALAHLAIAFALAIAALYFCLRVFSQAGLGAQLGQELERGNTAVGALMAVVVFAVSVFIADGVNSLSRSIAPQPQFGFGGPMMPGRGMPPPPMFGRPPGMMPQPPAQPPQAPAGQQNKPNMPRLFGSPQDQQPQAPSGQQRNR